MKYQKLLIAFMWAKQKVLESHGITLAYMDKEVEEAMLKWDEAECKSIYTDIVDEIQVYECSGLDSDNCPFCTKHENFYGGGLNCSECGYGEIKGKCNIGSIFSEVDAAIEKAELPLGEALFSNEVLVKIIKEIEEKA